jgi:hypothetical protein
MKGKRSMPPGLGAKGSNRPIGEEELEGPNADLAKKFLTLSDHVFRNMVKDTDKWVWGGGGEYMGWNGEEVRRQCAPAAWPLLTPP